MDAGGEALGMGRIWIAGGRSTPTNGLIVGALHEQGTRAALVDPFRLGGLVQDEDVVLARIDVRATLDGIEDGIWDLRRLERRGIRVLNPPTALIGCHDKLETALALARAGVPHPSTAHLRGEAPLPAFEFPLVVKPRYGSWGVDVEICESPRRLRHVLRVLHRRPWYRRHGALAQALVPPVGFDLRLLVAGGRVIGGVERVAAAGEWRTNIALGGTRRPADPPAAARELAVAAAAAVGADLVGVDLLPLPGGQYVVIELNGAADFTSGYSLDGTDVFDEVAAFLRRALDEREIAARAASGVPAATPLSPQPS
jgi:[lysine-biosynthesis-protein LysW]--L-2-aminoadipate ligase